MVDDTGTIIAINEGAATVSAITSDGGYVANCLVIVNKDNNNLDYHIDNSMISLNKGNKQTLSIKNARLSSKAFMLSCLLLVFNTILQLILQIMRVSRMELLPF